MDAKFNARALIQRTQVEFLVTGLVLCVICEVWGSCCQTNVICCE
jgi:hypothetical protein